MKRKSQDLRLLSLFANKKCLFMYEYMRNGMTNE